MSEDYQSAALRHLSDAEVLATNSCWGGAGHLIGLAAECAIKHRIETLRPAQRAPHAHFPEIIEAAKRHVERRRDSALNVVLKLPNLMAGWMIRSVIRAMTLSAKLNITFGISIQSVWSTQPVSDAELEVLDNEHRTIYSAI